MAKRRGIAVDEQLEQYQLKAILAMTKPMRDVLASGSDVLPDMAVTGGYVALALSAQNYIADTLTAALAHNVALRQQTDGSWKQLTVRPPVQFGDIQATAYGARPLQLSGPEGRRK